METGDRKRSGSRDAKGGDTSGNESGSSAKSQPQPLAIQLRQDKPQGFEAGKAAKRGVFVCFWGCEQTFASNYEAGNHPCTFRRKTFQDFVETAEVEGTQVPQAYVLEANGIIQPSGNYRGRGGGSPGSTDSTPWTKEILNEALGVVDDGKNFIMEKFINALPRV